MNLAATAPETATGLTLELEDRKGLGEWDR